MLDGDTFGTPVGRRQSTLCIGRIARGFREQSLTRFARVQPGASCVASLAA
ncbi:MAG: hypothetical protein MI923_19590 [Phycisphaerales bacterium]|nr:hypothetical protein [Phycisphaerales bacterium]